MEYRRSGSGTALDCGTVEEPEPWAHVSQFTNADMDVDLESVLEMSATERLVHWR